MQQARLYLAIHGRDNSRIPTNSGGGGSRLLSLAFRSTVPSSIASISRSSFRRRGSCIRLWSRIVLYFAFDAAMSVVFDSLVCACGHPVLDCLGSGCLDPFVLRRNHHSCFVACAAGTMSETREGDVCD